MLQIRIYFNFLDIKNIMMKWLYDIMRLHKLMQKRK